MSAPSAAVEVEHLVKRYPKNPVPAVDDVSFQIARGELFGLLGPNGAGKTTTIGVLTTRVKPSGGRARVSGVDVVADPVAARRHLAVVPQRNNLDRSLSIRKNLLFHAAYHGVGPKERRARADELLGLFGLSERANDKVDMFSGGQAQRAMIARALMHEPDVLFLDEPSTGLDPAARLFVWDRIRDLRERGVTVLLTTHDMEEAETLADHVGIMDHGRVLALDTPSNLTRSLPGSSTLDVTFTLKETGAEQLLTELKTMDGIERTEALADAAPTTNSPGAPTRIRLYVTGEAAAMIAPVAARIAALGGGLVDVGVGSPSLEDVFIALTGRALR